MGLKNDWSFAYFLYYMVIFGCCSMAVGAILNSVPVFNSQTNSKIRSVPVSLQFQEKTADQEFQIGDMKIDIPDRAKTKIAFQATNKDSTDAVFYIYLVKLSRYAILFTVLFLFSRILKHVANENPFHKRNATYFFVSGWILVFAPFLFFIAQKFKPFPVEDISNSEVFSSVSLNFFVEPYFFYAGIAMLVLGYVFKEGTKIYNEQKLTV